jgi:ubiquinone/menaquinone biosynthesis C-methylase UbiE
MEFSNRIVFNPSVWRFASKYFYPFVTRFGSSDDMVFLNNGYEENPPMGLPLTASDEPNRAPIQLYHRTATQVEITGKKVLEVSSGHGGGASYLTRTLRPASYTGLDLNSVGIDFCRRRHDLPHLNFVQGNAENLPFPDESFDAVINVEASHCYPNLSRFLSEVARVLRSGGHFLYADVFPRDRAAGWDAVLADTSLRMLARKDINEQVLLGMELNSQRAAELINQNVPSFLKRLGVDGTGADKAFHRALKDGEFSWRMYEFIKD